MLAWQACKKLRGFARVFPFGQPRSWLFQGEYAWLADKPGKAHKAWAKSLAYAEELNMPYEQGLAHYEIGRHLLDDNRGREDHLEQAGEIFAHLDAGWDLERVQKV